MVDNPHGIHRDRSSAAVRQRSSDDGGGEFDTTRPEWNHNFFWTGVGADAVREQKRSTTATDATGDHGFGGRAHSVEQRRREHDRVAPDHAAALWMQLRMYAM